MEVGKLLLFYSADFNYLRSSRLGPQIVCVTVNNSARARGPLLREHVRVERRGFLESSSNPPNFSRNWIRTSARPRCIIQTHLNRINNCETIVVSFRRRRLSRVSRVCNAGFEIGSSDEN